MILAARCRSIRAVSVSRYGVRELRCTLARHDAATAHHDQVTGWQWPSSARRGTPLLRVWVCQGVRLNFGDHPVAHNTPTHGVEYLGTEEQARAAGWGIRVAAGRIEATCGACRGAPAPPAPVLVPHLSREPMGDDQPLPGV